MRMTIPAMTRYTIWTWVSSYIWRQPPDDPSEDDLDTSLNIWEVIELAPRSMDSISRIASELSISLDVSTRIICMRLAGELSIFSLLLNEHQDMLQTETLQSPALQMVARLLDEIEALFTVSPTTYF
jgi:hypothetical protein